MPLVQIQHSLRVVLVITRFDYGTYQLVRHYIHASDTNNGFCNIINMLCLNEIAFKSFYCVFIGALLGHQTAKNSLVHVKMVKSEFGALKMVSKLVNR